MLKLNTNSNLQIKGSKLQNKEICIHCTKRNKCKTDDHARAKLNVVMKDIYAIKYAKRHVRNSTKGFKRFLLII